MTKEQVKHLMHILQAYVNGEPLQYFKVDYDCEPYLPLRPKNSELHWKDVNDSHDFNPYLYEYRIKPNSKYRPFKDAEECWQEMQKHQPFGWVKYKKENKYTVYCIIDGNCDFQADFEDFNFADGTPFGIKEE